MSTKPTIDFYNTTAADKSTAKHDVGIYVMPENPLATYAEGYGDNATPNLSPTVILDLIAARAKVTTLIVVLISGI